MRPFETSWSEQKIQGKMSQIFHKNKERHGREEHIIRWERMKKKETEKNLLKKHTSNNDKSESVKCSSFSAHK